MHVDLHLFPVRGRVAHVSGGFPFPLRNCGCPVLAFFATAGSDAAHTTLVPSAETALRMRSWFPPFANCAKDGAPPVLVVPARSKAGPPATPTLGDTTHERVGHPPWVATGVRGTRPCKERKDGAPPGIGCACEVKSWATRPGRFSVQSRTVVALATSAAVRCLRR